MAAILKIEISYLGNCLIDRHEVGKVTHIAYANSIAVKISNSLKSRWQTAGILNIEKSQMSLLILQTVTSKLLNFQYYLYSETLF